MWTWFPVPSWLFFCRATNCVWTQNSRVAQFYIGSIVWNLVWPDLLYCPADIRYVLKLLWVLAIAATLSWWSTQLLGWVSHWKWIYTGLVRGTGLVVASEIRCEGSMMVDEERMRPGHWLQLVLCVPFTGLILTVGWQEGQPACEKPLFH